MGSYQVEVMSIPEECDWPEFLPIELQYIFKKHPGYKEKIRAILKAGKAIGVRTTTHTPENVLQAVHDISIYSQHNYVITWLPKLLSDKHVPVVTADDRALAVTHGVNLDQAIETITRDRLRFKHLVLIDEENRGISSEEQRFMTELSELIYPLQVEYAVYRVTADNAHERTATAQAIIKMLLVVGPIAHVLEKFAAGIGKIFAASADDILGETAELFALRGSGFSWRVLIKRSHILIPVFLAASYGAYSVEHLLSTGHAIWGGIIFGVSAVALSVTTAIQSIFLYLHNVKKLTAEGKTTGVSEYRTGLRVALTQDFTNPARFGLFLGALCAPFFGVIGSVLGLMHSGWVLAGIGSTESIIAGLTVIFAGRINEARFRKKLLRSMR